MIPAEYIRQYWFGTDDPKAVADTVLLMERNRLEQYQAALDFTEVKFQGVFQGLTGRRHDRRISIIYSIGPAHVADCVAFLSRGFGVQRCVATGSIGGLSTNMGDIVIASACGAQDGYSLAEFGDEVREDSCLGRYVEHIASPTPDIAQQLRSQIERRFECEVRTGKLFTVPAVSLERVDFLKRLPELGYCALDLETGPFLGACRTHDVAAHCIHWVTDLPLERNFYYQYHGDEITAKNDREKKHRQWLNMPRLILPLVDCCLSVVVA